MIPDDEWHGLKGDIQWAYMNLEQLPEKARPFVADLAQQVAEYGQFMHMTTRQTDWFRRIMEGLECT